MSLSYRVKEVTREVEVFDEDKPLRVLVLPANDSRAVLIRGGGLDALNANALTKLKKAVLQAPELPPVIKEEWFSEEKSEDELDPESPELAPETNVAADVTVVAETVEEAKEKLEAVVENLAEVVKDPNLAPEENEIAHRQGALPQQVEADKESTTEQVFSGAHLWDPCIYCGAGHDDVDLGECPGPTSAEKLEDDAGTPPSGEDTHALSSDSEVEETVPDDAEISVSVDGAEKPEKKPAKAKKSSSKTKKKTPKAEKKVEKPAKEPVEDTDTPDDSEAPAEKEETSEIDE
ncbi:hypothetical protein LCGC14_0914800 [marine sediment metagenome]|uniref:Uncharacterized protein n=1 Tax=marine sediment metagenome TaxID=412755 RepID=A0A0F9RBC4_9ZZZZ